MAEQLPQTDVFKGPSSEQEMAAALDAALDAIQAGHPVDRRELLARHPALASALGALDHLFAPTSTGASAGNDLPLARPERIGPYQIERELGAGGFGVVYLAFDPDVKRWVAIKVLHPGRIDQPDAISRFQREAHATGRLRHPGIVQLFDYSRQGPPYYLVTEYVAGVEPRLWCRDRGTPPAEIAALVARMADAVEYAHQQGVYHRDLKPGNVLIDAEGQPHILDFGLARIMVSEGATLSARTGEGDILGSLPYMPPEQASGQSHTADERSDVYSLGVILYELLTGCLPFQGPAHSLPARVVEENPTPPREHNPSLSADLEAICLKALAKRPQDRYASAAELAADLRAYLEGQPITARRLTIWGRIRTFLDRRHLETLRQGWTLLLLLLGVTILVGSIVCNYWELNLKPGRSWLPILLTKGVQVAVMLLLAFRLRPAEELPLGRSSLTGAHPSNAGTRPALTAAERQIWSLVPGYYGSFLTLVIINTFLEEPIPLAPVLAMLSGMGFSTLGATIWGWFYVWGAAFFVLAFIMVFLLPYGLTLLGVGWFLCLVIGSIHLQWTR
jgi:serine/threonine protein kinase